MMRKKYTWWKNKKQTSIPALVISQAPSAMRKWGDRPLVTLMMNLNMLVQAIVSSCVDKVTCVRKNRPDDINNETGSGHDEYDYNDDDDADGDDGYS